MSVFSYVDKCSRKRVGVASEEVTKTTAEMSRVSNEKITRNEGEGYLSS